jgi:hypothetical protein
MKPNPDKIMASLVDHIKSRRLLVTEIDGILNLRSGPGPRAQTACIDASSWIEDLVELSEFARPQAIASYGRGVRAGLSVSSRDRSWKWSFKEAAGRLLPSLETSRYCSAVDAVFQQRCVRLQIADCLAQVVQVETDQGRRPLCEEDLARWSSSQDRVMAAARSMLFHRTQRAKITPSEESSHLYAAIHGDNYDTARYLVLSDFLFGELESPFWFAAPSLGCLYFAQSSETATALRAATQSTFETATEPISKDLFTYDGATVCEVTS